MTRVMIEPVLQPGDLESMQALIAICAAVDSITVVISLYERPSRLGETLLITAHVDGTLIGLAGIPPGTHPEASLVVHPDWRRQGIGSQLMNAVRSEIRSRDLPWVLVVADMQSPTAEPFLLTVGAKADFSEYRLVCTELNPVGTPVPIPGLIIRPAIPKDIDLLVQLEMAAFGQSDAHTREHVTAGMQETKRHFAIAEMNGTPIGMIRRGEWDGIGDITALGVIPAWQGRGIGRQLLVESTKGLLEAGYDRVEIEVATDNPNALALYQSVGYRITNRFGYYRLES